MFLKTMKIHSLFVLLFSGYGLCRIESNVFLVDHTSYAINVVTRTMNIVEENGWCNLKLPDYVLQLNESILFEPFKGTLRYTNGFVSAIQHVDIVQSTVQQVFNFNASAANTHTVTIRATMRLHDVAVGYDVTGHLHDDDEVYRYTAVYVHPLISFVFSIIKDLNTDDIISVTVVGSVPATFRDIEFRPKNTISDIFAQTFNAADVTAKGIAAWGPQVFQPITFDLVTREIPFPAMCYNCARPRGS